MNSAYSVGASFVIENLASPELSKLALQLERLDGLIEDVKVNFKTIVPTNLARQINSVGLAFDALPASAEKASSGMILALGRAEAGAEKTTDVMRLRFDSTFVGMDAAADKAASGMIAAMGRAETEIGASAKAMGTSVGGVFAGMDVGLSSATDVITHEFSRITAGANRSSRAIGKLRGELASLSTLSSLPLPQLPGMGGGGGGGIRTRGARGNHGGGNGENGGFHLAPETMNTPVGRVSGHGGAGAAIAGAALFGDAILEAAEVEDIVTRILMTGQITPGKHPLVDTEQGRRTFAVIQKGAVDTGFSQKQVGEMMLGTEREFQGLDFNQKMDTLSMLLPAMGAEAHQRETSLKEAGENLVAMMHMSGTFDPKDIPEIARAFQFTTMTTPVDLPQFKSALSYSMPVLHGALGMDPSTIMLLTSMMQTAGVTNTKSGTWLRSFFVDAEPSTDVLGPLTKSQVQHNKALEMLGVAGADGKQNWKINGTDGKTDWNASVINLANELKKGIDSIEPGQRADVLHRAFGTQGSGMATLLEQQTFRDQLPVLAGKMKMYKGGDFTLGEYSEGSTIQQSRIAMQEFQVLMADLGTKILPGVNAILKEVSGDLRALPADWEATKKMWGFGPEEFGPPAPKNTGPLAPGGAAGDANDYGLGASPMAYRTNLDGSPIGGTTGGQSDATRALEDVVYRGTLHALLEAAMGGSGGAGGGGGHGGIINASWGGGGGGGGGSGGGWNGNPLAVGGGFGSAGWSKSGSTRPQVADYIKSHAVAMGIDPNVALRVAQSEGLDTYVGDYGTSFGAFQLHYGGSGIRGMNNGGLGDAFTKATGLNARDPTTWKAQVDFALKSAKHDGWGAWHGASHVGIGNRQGLDFHGPSVGAYRPPRASPSDAAPHGPAHGAAPDISASNTPSVVHTHVHLDGKVIARSTTKYIAAAMKYPTTMGGPDPHSHYVSPATPVTDSA